MVRKKFKKAKPKQKKKKQSRKTEEDSDLVNAPHTFVFHRGKVGENAKNLVTDMRRVMEPFTASKLQARKSNILKDFVALAGPLKVSHFLIFTKTQKDINLRLMRLPRGPTLHFKVVNYCLKSDVESSLKRPKSAMHQYSHSPLLVLNGFQNLEDSSSENKLSNPHKLCATMLQNMFPSINIQKVSLNGVKRCVLFNFDSETGLIEFRHYNIAVKPVGVHRRVKKLVTRSSVPNMGKLTDISEYLLAPGDTSASESEYEVDDATNKIDLPQKMTGVGNKKNSKSAVRLTELGPRLTLELYKIEEGICSGEVLFHNYIEKTEEEKQSLRDMIHKKQKLKLKRKAIQEENVKKKQKKKEMEKLKSQQAARNCDIEVVKAT